MLSGLKILDFSRLLPGPFATKVLADLGASVTRVVHPSLPDMMEDFGPPHGDTSTLDFELNHRKETLKLDLKEAEAQQNILRIISDFDVVIEGFRPGVMARFGLDYKTLREINPEIIYCSITGYGQESTRRSKAGHDINYVALSGIPSYSGTEHPPILGAPIADLSGSMYAASTILAAVIRRDRTGVGAYLDVPMRDCVVSLGILENNTYLNSTELPQRQTTLINGGSIYDYYQTQDGRYLSVGSLEPKFRKQLLDNLGIAETSSKPEIAEKIRSKPLSHWVQVFDDVDACVEAVLTLDEVFDGVKTVEKDGVRMQPFPVKIL